MHCHVSDMMSVHLIIIIIIFVAGHSVLWLHTEMVTAVWHASGDNNHLDLITNFTEKFSKIEVGIPVLSNKYFHL